MKYDLHRMLKEIERDARAWRRDNRQLSQREINKLFQDRKTRHGNDRDQAGELPQRSD